MLCCDVRNVFSNVDIRKIGMYEVPMLLSLFGLGIGMMLVSFHT